MIYKKIFDIIIFCINVMFWTRYNHDADTNKYIEGEISGKYLNEIHNELVTKTF